MQRTIFNSTLNVNELLVKTTSVANISSSEEEKMLNIFNKYGVCLLEHDETNNPKDNIINLKKYFGDTVGHDRADTDGITEIANLAGFQDYLGASHEEHPLHTGGIYSETPPIIILLQCIRQSETGGDSILVSSKLIKDFLLKEDPDGFQALSQRDALTMRRGNAKASRPVFDKNILGNGNYMFSFRCDNIIEFTIKPAKLVTTISLIKNFIDNPKNQLKFKLKRNQIMIADNSAVMHARTAFPADSDRLLLRITLDGKTKNPINLGFS